MQIHLGLNVLASWQWNTSHAVRKTLPQVRHPTAVELTLDTIYKVMTTLPVFLKRRNARKHHTIPCLPTKSSVAIFKDEEESGYHNDCDSGQVCAPRGVEHIHENYASQNIF